MTTAFTNYGSSSTSNVTVSLTTPSGWVVTAGSAATGNVNAGETITTTWAVRPPVGTAPGRYTIDASGDYTWGGRQDAAVTATLAVTVPPLTPSGTVHVSDLEWTFVANGWGPVERDRSNGESGPGDGGTITIGGVTYAKGVGAHATSNILIYTGGACGTFIATVGVDDEVGDNGSVTFEVWADGRKITETGVLRGTDPGHALSADVTGADEVELRITQAGDGPGFDHADWADAILTC